VVPPQVAVHMEVEDINAHLTRLDGVGMLDKLRQEGRLEAALQLAVPLADGADSRDRVPTDSSMEQQRQQPGLGSGAPAAATVSAGSPVAGVGPAAA
jgi:hypothetical protein